MEYINSEIIYRFEKNPNGEYEVSSEGSLPAFLVVKFSTVNEALEKSLKEQLERSSNDYSGLEIKLNVRVPKIVP